MNFSARSAFRELSPQSIRYRLDESGERALAAMYITIITSARRGCFEFDSSLHCVDSFLVILRRNHVYSPPCTKFCSPPAEYVL